MKRTAIISAIAIALIAFGLIGIKSFNNSRPSDKEDPLQHNAAINYQNYCAGCHGDNLEKFAVKAWMEEEGSTSAFNSIKFGIVDIGMPAFQNTFTDEEIEALADYVKKGIPEDKSMLKPAVTTDGVIESERQRFVVDTVVTGLDVPWGLAFLPDGDLLISERAGTLHRFSNGKLSPPVEGLPPVMVFGQGGLLDLCLHPEYEKNGWIYLAYSALNTESSERIGNTSVMRAKLKGNKLVDVQIIFKGLPDTDRGHHFGCKLAFDKKGYLYFGIGDRGQHFDFPQKLDNHNGKIHRINDDGSIPADNPFVNTPGAMPSIYSYGHRNPQGTCIHPLTDELWESEHGPRGGDELNLIRPGLNYGWPVISYGINYDGTILTDITEKDGLEQPVFYWTPSIAPCGMTFVTGTRYKFWHNNLLMGSLRFHYLERIVLKGHSVIHREKLLEDIGRVRNVVIGPDGLIYVAIENPGKIVRLVPVE
ncbi:MAG: PQQ-dependent sugar dehydrogenase [Bacteroidales bacterium]|nr:PQQ-dependent sugar dehydrogenase [Bacteroidales bacterium]MBN2761603.1 PQQ-dependent sugar dehydrogenase [Bacteroidales bacterium]